MAQIVTIDNQVAALNQFCDQQAPMIRQTLRNGLELENTLPHVTCDHTYTASNLTVGNIVQPYQWQFTPNNTETFSGVSNTLQHGKVDMIFTADQLEKFNDGWRCDWFELDKNPLEWSYARYIMTEGVLPKFEEEHNSAVYNGIRVDPVAGTPGTPMQTFDGFGKKVADAITASDLVPIATGVLDPTTMVAQVRDFCKALPNPYRYKTGIILMSKTNAQAYADDYQAKYPTRQVTESTPDAQYLRVDHMNKQIQGLTCMEGSNRMIIYYPDLRNMIIGTRRGQSLFPRFRFEKHERTLKVMAEYSRFFGFEHWGHVYVNDQA